MWTRSRPLFNALFALSAVLNMAFFLYLFLRPADREAVEPAECRLYPEDTCSADFPATMRDHRPIFPAYSIRGEQMIFLDFSLKGTLAESVEAKYGQDLSVDMVRNIQTLVYFFLDYQVRLGPGDRISLFYRPDDGRILYLRLRSRSYNSLFEAFLYQMGGTERYLAADGSVFPPCIKNAPFDGCPGVRLEKRQNILVPVFLLPPETEVRLPFDAWVLSVTGFAATGGALQVTFPDHGLVGFFEYLGTIDDRIRTGRRYKAGTPIGTSGFAKREGYDGVRYYLERRDGTPVSPFFFHHTFLSEIPENERTNVTITQNFYRNWYREGLSFEKRYY